MKIKKLVKEYLAIGVVYCIVTCFKQAFDVEKYAESKGLDFGKEVLPMLNEHAKCRCAEVKHIPLNEKIGNALLNILNWPSLIVHTNDHTMKNICKRIDEKVTSSSLQ